MRRRGNSRLCLFLSRLSLPPTPSEFGSCVRAYVHGALSLQVMLAIGIIIALAAGVSMAVARLIGSANQRTTSEKRLSNAPLPDTPGITLQDLDSSGLSNRLPLAEYVTCEGETIAGIAGSTGRLSKPSSGPTPFPSPISRFQPEST